MFLRNHPHIQEEAVAHLSRSIGSIFVLSLLLISGLPVACSAPNDEASDPKAAEETEREPEIMSLLGEPLYAHEDVRGFIANADQTLTTDPNNLDLILAVAEIRGSAWQFNGAIELYTRAIELAEDDWRAYRFRGHRYISTRQFDKAVADLEKARELFPESLDVANHLGLAYYLQGSFDEAADEYGRCFAMAEDNGDPEEDGSVATTPRTCALIGEQESERIAITDWAYRALRRAGRDEEAKALLETIGDDWIPEANEAYYLDLLFHKGRLTEEEVLSPENLKKHRYETLAYGLANWHLVEGNESEAVQYLNQIVAGKYWPGFGRIAAEADLERMKATGEKGE
jgi:tetratricopeptide (TPR) repeat protein